MKTFIYILLKFCLCLELFHTVGSSQSFKFEKLRNLAIGRPNMGDYRRMNMFKNKNEYPEPLPLKKRKLDSLVPSPYHSIYQGRRMPNDTRVFRRRFEYEPQPQGHHVYCEGTVNCIISHLAIETAGGIPILLRGGAGYRYFVVVAKARPYDALIGSVRAYCVNMPNEYYSEKPNIVIGRSLKHTNIDSMLLKA